MCPCFFMLKNRSCKIVRVKNEAERVIMQEVDCATYAALNGRRGLCYEKMYTYIIAYFRKKSKKFKVGGRYRLKQTMARAP